MSGQRNDFMDKTIQNQSVTSPDAAEFFPKDGGNGFNKDGAMKVWNDKLNHNWGHPGFSKDATTGQWRNNDPTFVHDQSGQWHSPNIPPQVQTPGMSQDASGQWHNNMDGQNFSGTNSHGSYNSDGTINPVTPNPQAQAVSDRIKASHQRHQDFFNRLKNK